MKKLISVLLLATLFLRGTSYAEIITDKLIQAIITIESGGDPNAIGKNGEIGLIQISSIVVKEFHQIICEPHCNDIFALYDPKTNIALGTWYLKRLHNHYKCETLEQILCAYNWGIGNLRKIDMDWTKSPSKVKRYISRVKKEMEN